MSTALLDDILQRVESLPTLSSTSQRLVAVVHNPESSIRQIVDTIRFDQAVTTSLLRLCNSAFFGLSRRIESIDEAARYVGTNRLMQIVMAAHTHALLGPEQAGYGLRPGALWKHSVGVALASQLIADRQKEADKGAYFTTGLLHDIGKILLNEYISQEYACIAEIVAEHHMSFVEAELQVLGTTHAEVGARVAERWGLPEQISFAVRFHHAPSKATNPTRALDAVHVADAACLLMGVGGGDDGQLYRLDTTALDRLGLRSGDIEIIGAEAVAELKSVQELFGIR